MDALCLRRHVAFRIEVFAEGASRWHMVQQFQGGDLDDAVAGGRIEAGGFGVENDLAHHTSLFRAAPGRQALRRRSPPVRNSLTMPASWRKLCRLPRPVCTTRSEEHTSELQSLMRNSYAVFCLKKKTLKINCEKTCN